MRLCTLFAAHVYFLSFSDYLRMRQHGILDHEHRPPGGCNLSNDCPTKGEKLLRVIKLDLNASGNCEGEELDQGVWCDLCLKMGPTLVVRFTCLNEKCAVPKRLPYFPFNLCSICDKHGMVKCPLSGPEWQWKYPGSHICERVKKSKAKMIGSCPIL